MRAYNLFRHRDKPHLLCAVPEDHEVPRFIAERAWRFDRQVTETAAAPVGFDVLAVRHGGIESAIGGRLNNAEGHAGVDALE